MSLGRHKSLFLEGLGIFYGRLIEKSYLCVPVKGKRINYLGPKATSGVVAPIDGVTKNFRNNFVIHTYSFTFAVPKFPYGKFGCHCKQT
ncbi:hypothetical protein CLV59_101191 [Chitinophaga dinghuensis]|uniref:Uncharacterized protein n=1 Tax=Chitinophaga dinghuensis TaxID=1539050 RepID=A0A327WDK4_9BACT|nr:hypothetical protein CLV59_101191 [Chitinophaga dinghuensis]